MASRAESTHEFIDSDRFFFVFYLFFEDGCLLVLLRSQNFSVNEIKRAWAYMYRVPAGLKAPGQITVEGEEGEPSAKCELNKKTSEFVLCSPRQAPTVRMKRMSLPFKSEGES